jgi:flagellar M-ring protein FliF
VNSSFRGEVKPEDVAIESLPIWENPLVRDIAKLLAGLIVLIVLVVSVLRPLVRGLLAAPRPAFTPAIAGPEAAVIAGQPKVTALDYDGQVAHARSLVNQDPGRVAQVVKTWVGNDE